MTRFSDRLKLSVSAIALMGGGMAATTSARAATITGTQAMVTFSVLTDDLTVAGTGIVSPGGLTVANLNGDLLNSGLIEATTGVMVTTTGDTDIDVQVTALDIQNQLAGDFTNNGTVNAEANAAANVALTGAGLNINSLDATATAVFIQDLPGNATNNGTISAVASADLAVTAGTQLPSPGDLNINDDADAQAIALEIANVTGAVSNTSDLTVSAQASGTVSYLVNVTDSSATADISDIDNDAAATGIYVSNSGTYSFDNSGTVTADATLTGSADVSVMATTAQATIYITPFEQDVEAFAVYLRGDVTGFTNSGTIAGTATSNLTLNAAATGATGADVDVTPSVSAFASAVYIQDLNGDFDNSGTISAVAVASFISTVSAAGQATNVTAEIDGEVEAGAYAVDISNFDGSLTNSSTMTIEASASAIGNHTLSASGFSPSIHADEPDHNASAYGIYISGGNYDIDNSGAVSATAHAEANHDANATATAGSAFISISEVSAFASAYGVYGGHDANGFVNSGSVTADASSSSTTNANATAVGPSGNATVEVSISEITASAYAVYLQDLNGDFDNSGTIAATATAADSVTASTSSADGSAKIDIDDDVFAFAQGVRLREFDGSFTNSSDLTISASAAAVADYDLDVAGNGFAEVVFDNVDMDATATGVDIDNGQFDATNTGTIAATGSVTANYIVDGTATNGSVSVGITDLDLSAYAYGFYSTGTAQGFVNSGSITADASIMTAGTINATGTSEVTISLTNDIDSSAWAVYLQTLEGDFDNSGTIAATVTADLAVTANANDLTSAQISVEDRHYAGAYGVGISSFNGSFTNSSNLTISADAAQSVSYDVEAVGSFASVSINDLDQTVSAYGLWIGSGTYDIDNSGTISANAVGSSVLNATATAVPGSTAAVGNAASIFVTLSAEVTAYGVFAGGADTVTGFSNSGTITANAAYAAVQNLAANGLETATISISSNSISVSAYGVYVRDMEDDFDNSGTIAATAAASLDVTASAIDGREEATIYIYDDGIEAYAYGVYLDDFTGTLTNSSPQSISATASADVSYDLDAVGTYASVSAETQSLTVSAIGLFIETGTYDIDNTGAISADASANLTISANATATDNYAEVDIDDATIEVYAYGIEGDGTANSFTSSGTISATGAATLTETVVVNGVTSASADVDNDVTVEVVGVLLENTLAGDFINSGGISATGSAAYVGNISSTQAAGPDFVDIDNDFDVDIAGVVVDFVADPGEGEMPVPTLRNFTNAEGGEITATGSLTMMQTVVAGAQDVPTDTMAAPADTPEIATDADLSVVGALLTGGLGTATNNGTISAAGTIQAPNGTAAVRGIELPDVADGFVFTNTGDLSASLEGVAAAATVAALHLGPTTATQGPAETSPTTSAPPAPGMITVNNSGTIAATNTTGVGRAVGIGTETAPEPVTINQSGGSISGSTAIAMDQGNDDTLNWTGGTIHGLVDADSGDVVNVFGGGVVTAGTDFALEGAGTVNVNLPSSTSASPTMFMVLGSITNTGTLNINPYGNFYVGIPATIELGGDTFNMVDGTTTLTIDVMPGAAGSLSTTGDANIDGTLTASPKAGLYLDTETFRIITADSDGSNGTVPTGTGTGTAPATTPDGVNGTFDAVTGDTLLLRFTGIINPTSVDLRYDRVAFDEAVELDGNAWSVASGVEDGYDPLLPADTNNPDLNNVLGHMFVLNDADAYRDTLLSWAGAEHAQVIQAAVNLAEPYFMAIGEHLNDTRMAGMGETASVAIRSGVGGTLTDPNARAGDSGGDKKASFWGRAFGRWTDINGDSNAPGFDEEIFGIVIGFDYAISENVKIGIAGAYTDDSIDFDDGDEADIERFTIGGYVSAVFDQFYADASFSYADDDYKVHRTVQYGDWGCPTFDCTVGASSDYSGDAFLFHGELGYVVNPGNGDFRVQPFIGVNYTDINVDSFTESGAGDLGLGVNDGGGESVQSRLGVRLSGNWDAGGTTIIRPELRVEWRHEFEDDPHAFRANLIGDPGIGFTTIGSKISSDMAVIGVGATATFENGIGAFFEYQGAFGSGYSSHIVQVGARVRF